MRKKRSERQPAESGSSRWTRNKTRQQQDEAPALSKIEPFLKESPLGRSRSELQRNTDTSSREMDPSLEETLLAFLDSHGVRDVEDIVEDKLTFLDATYARCGVRADASLPTKKMFEAIFHNVQESQSVELTTTSFQLLKDLEKRHPRVAIAAEEADEYADQPTDKLHVDRNVWSPIEQMIEDIESTEMLSVASPIPLNLLALTEKITMSLRESGNCHEGVETVGQFLTFQHLVSLIEKDLYCRLQVYKARKDISDVQESYLYRLICVLRPDMRKAFLSNLVFLLKPRGQHMRTDEEVAHVKDVGHGLTRGCDVEASKMLGPLPSTSDFSHLAYRLLFMVMEIDHLTKTWNPGNSRSQRRCSFPDDLLSIFSDAGDLEAYLAALDSPGSKLRFIVDYFVANAPQVVVGKGLKDSVGRDTIEKFLACFGEDKTKKFLHKFGEDVLPVLLAHAFQASLLLCVEGADEDPNEQPYRGKLVEVSQLVVETLTHLRQLEGQTEMLPVAEQALQMADSIFKVLISS